MGLHLGSENKPVKKGLDVIMTLFRKICFFTIAGVTFSSNGVQSAITPSGGSIAVISKGSAQSWQKMITGKRGIPCDVVWEIKITDVSSFGGFYVKGHLLDTKNAKFHLIWQPESTPSGALRGMLVEGETITVIGDFEGVTTGNEAIISVKSFVKGEIKVNLREGWNPLKCGFLVLIDDGQPIRVSDGGDDSLIQFGVENVIAAELVEISGSSDCSIGTWSDIRGESDCTAPVFINQ